MAGAAGPDDPAAEPRRHRPHGRGLRLRRGVPDPRPRRGGAGRRRGADDVAGVVARRLRSLRAAHGPDDVALRRHLPCRRRPGRRGRRDGALRAAEQLAGQPQPRQGAPAAVAGQEEVRRRALLGRPDGLRRYPCPGDHGPSDLRLRRGSGGRLRARRGRLLGPRARLARRRAPPRRPRARHPPGRRPDGPDLRQPGGSEHRPRPGHVGPGHPPDVPGHGLRRRGDRRADGGRAHLRQDPRRGRPGASPRPGARGRAAGGAGAGVEVRVRARHRTRHRHQRPRTEPGPPPRRGGTTATWRPCSATSGTWR